MTIKEPKIYIGCSLTQASEEFRAFISLYKNAIRKMGFEVFEFMGLSNGTPKDVYRHDIEECVAKCDIFIAICDYPSIGLGYELALAVEKRGIPTIAFAGDKSQVTRLVIGIDKKNFTFERYSSLEDLVRKTLLFLGSAIKA